MSKFFFFLRNSIRKIIYNDISIFPLLFTEVEFLVRQKITCVLIIIDSTSYTLNFGKLFVY